MVKKTDKKAAKQESAKKELVQETPIGFTRINYILFAVGAGLILLGFLFLSSPTFGGGFPFIHPFKAGVNGWLSMNAAPVLLVLGYCVVIPVAIIKK
jgi:NADH:ubiquinone oxidoreductase subunit H